MEEKTTIRKQYLQYLHKIKLPYNFPNFGSQGRAMKDRIVDTHYDFPKTISGFAHNSKFLEILLQICSISYFHVKFLYM